MLKSATLNRPKKQRRRRFQTGSLQKRKNGNYWVWIGFWWEEGSRRAKTLGKVMDMSKGDALTALGKLLQPINVEAVKPVERRWTLTELIDESYLPYCRRKWKASTASTTEDRIQYHIVRDLGKMEIHNVTRDMLQRYLERKTKEGLSHSVVHHLRWDLPEVTSMLHNLDLPGLDGDDANVPFDPDRLATAGTPAPFLADVAGNSVDGGGQFDGSMNGSFVYVSGKSAASSSYPIVLIDSSGKTTPLLAKPGAYGAPRFSPDGKRLAFTAMGSKGPDVWVYDLERDTSTQLTFTGPGNLEMAWTPDGKHIVFGSNTVGTAALWWIRSDGSREPQKLLERKNTGIGLRPQSFKVDGGRLILAFDDNVTTGAGVEIWTLPLDVSEPEHPKPGKPEPFLTTAARQVDATFSPDGKWMAYSSNESGLDDIFVRPFPGPGGKQKVSTGGGKFPTWSRTGELFYFSLSDGRIMVVNYTVQGESFSFTKPRVWSDRQLLLPNFIRVLDMDPGGKRFAGFPRPEIEEAKGNLHVTFLLNFFDELRRRSP